MTKDLATLQTEFNEQIIERIGVKLRTDEIKSLVKTALSHNDFAKPMEMAATNLRQQKFAKLSQEEQRKTDVRSIKLSVLEKLQILIQVKAWKGDNVIEKLLSIQSQLAQLSITTSQDYDKYLAAINPIVNQLKWLNPEEQVKQKKSQANDAIPEWNSKTWALIQKHLEEVRKLKATKVAEEEAELQRIEEDRIEALKKLEEEKARQLKELEAKQLEEENAKKALEKEKQLEQTKEILEKLLINRLQTNEIKRPPDESQNPKVKVDTKETEQPIAEKRFVIDTKATVASETLLNYAKQLRDGDWLSWFLIPVFGYTRTRRYKAEKLEKIAQDVKDLAAKGDDYKTMLQDKIKTDPRLIKSCFWHETARTKNVLDNVINDDFKNYTKPLRRIK